MERGGSVEHQLKLDLFLVRLDRNELADEVSSLDDSLPSFNCIRPTMSFVSISQSYPPPKFGVGKSEVSYKRVWILMFPTTAIPVWRFRAIVFVFDIPPCKKITTNYSDALARKAEIHTYLTLPYLIAG